MYLFSEEGEELATLMEYPYKCFLRLLKEYSQIRMADNDEGKTGFHTKEGEVKGSVVKKFFRQGEQVQKTRGANKGETLNLNKELQVKLIPTPRAWRLYLGKEMIEGGSGIRIILVSPDEKMHSYAIRLKTNASDHAMDCEALLAGLVAFVNKGMKDLYVIIDSLTLVAHIEGNHTPATEHERKYKEAIMEAKTLFHRFRITHLPKILNSKAKMLTGLATIKLEFLNQEVSVGIKTRPSVEEISSSKKEKATNNVPGTNQTTIGRQVQAIKRTCNRNTYLVALPNPSEVAIFKVLAHLEGPIYFYI
uniref:RNase H type-1 domain-containing protein n=1 Tax=Tanacetum cinerariifolium TaxID=118510 RepID=A0A6L2MA33_TANCI|nr:hypothetical protein [Tanacetum cinerariifolium]